MSSVYMCCTGNFIFATDSSLSFHFSQQKVISIFHGYIVWIAKSITRVTDRQHEACRVIQNSDPELRVFSIHTMIDTLSCAQFDLSLLIFKVELVISNIFSF